ncbi:MAG TPA: amino acid adenylation domain-containing protein [Herpetosiphonaceae bacterium]
MADQGIDESMETIAIVGMAGRFPGAKTLREFWENLRDGVEGITFFSEDELAAAGENRALLEHPQYVKARAVLEDVDRFDAGFFGFTPREAELMDPQHRIFLECAWEALEDAGYVPENYDGAIGVFGSTLMSTYLLANLYPNQELMEASGALAVRIATDRDFLPTRVSYKLDLKGPSFCVQTACSSTLVGAHLAIKSLLDYECDIALVGGVSISVPQTRGYLYHEGGIYSPDGHCRAFDAQARGTVVGSGMGIVVLKRLEDALEDGDTIRAVIRGSAINNDGAQKVGYTAPSVESQAEVITMAQTVAKVEPETISYIEAHGTGTSLGDLVEVTALTQVFRESTDEKQFCALGSVKTNIGHLDAAAGVAGLIKTVLALQNKQIPPSLGYEQPNPEIDFANSPFRVNARLSDWISPTGPRRAGVSSFAVGGTNAHVVLEEAPEIESDEPERSHHVLILSARSTAALDQATEELAGYLEQNPALNLADVAYTLQRGRRAFDERRFVVCSDLAEAAQALRDPQRVLSSSQPVGDRSVVFMFPGQGAQYVNMGKDLYQNEAVFRAEVDRCAQILRPQLGLDLREILYPNEQRAETAAQQLSETWLTQPAIFVIEYALAKLWQSWGITPAAMIGHSIGEYVAATLAGVFSLDDALMLIATRGRLMQTLPAGAMLSVSLPAAEVQPLLDGSLSLAAINGPALCVVAGPIAAIEALQTRLAEQGVTTRRLHTSHAFHSAMMDPILPAFVERVRRVRLRAPQMPYLSNVTGTWITAQQATDPSYWAQHLRQPVRFADGLAELLQTTNRALLEVGPGRTLSTFARQQAPAANSATIATSLRHPQESVSDVAFLLNALGLLWLGGTAIDWSVLYGDERRLRVPLPTYPFERQRYWAEPPAQIAATSTRIATARKQTDIADWFYTSLWKESRLPQPAQAQPGARWLILSEAGTIGRSLAARLLDLGHAVTIARPASGWNIDSDGVYSINPAQPADVQALLDTIGVQPDERLRVIMVLSAADLHHNQYDHNEPRCDMRSLIAFGQTLGRAQLPGPIDLSLLTIDAQDVLGTEALALTNAPAAGVLQALASASSQLSCRSLDLSGDGSLNRRQLDQIIAELTAGAGDEPVAYRHNRRWHQIFEPQRWERPASSAAGLRPHGVYLLTDGVGKIGLALAEHLANTAQAQLVLLAPAEFPQREAWARALATADTATAETIRRLQTLEHAGAEILLVQADALEDAIDTARRQYGAIHGVIHGVEPDSTAQTAEQITWSLDETRRQLEALTQLDPADLDFVLLHTSLAPLVSGADLAGAGAIALMHTFARQCGQHSPATWLSVAWDAPSGSGADEWTMDEAETVEVFRRILDAPGSQSVIVATGDLLARRAARATQEAASEITITPTGTQYARPNLPTTYVAPTTTVERALVDLWQDLLGIAPIGIHDTFFDLGGHSLLATQVLSRIRDTFNTTLSLGEFFDAGTIAGIAQRIATATAAPAEDTLATIPVAARDGELPLSFAQQRLWFLQHLDPESAAYHMPFAVHLSGALSYAVLEQSITAIVQRHEALRTAFIAPEGTPYQVIVPPQPIPLPLVDLESMPAAEREAEIQRLLLDQAQQPFDLTEGRLLRCLLIRLGPDEHIVAITVHHIAADGWSMGVFIRELATLYATFSGARSQRDQLQLPDLTIQYADYAVWQRQLLQEDVLEAALAYWRQQLAGLPEGLALPTDRPRPAVQTFNGARYLHVLPQPLSADLVTLSQREGVTLFMTLLGAFQILLSRYSGQDDIVVGSPIAGRTHVALEHLIGLFVNTLVLRTDLRGNPTLQDVLHRVREVALGAYAQQHVPFERLVDEIQVNRDLSRSPLFQVLFTLQNTPVGELSLPELTLRPLPPNFTAAKFDLSFEIVEHAHGLHVGIEYNTDLFDAATIERLASHYQTVLETFVGNPAQRLSHIELLSTAERQLMIEDWNATASAYPIEARIHDLVMAQAARTPDAIAARFRDQVLTYRELQVRAQRLAGHLQTLGVGPDVRVGLCVERSLDLLVGVVGILAAGGAYIPLDPAYPAERLAFILSDAHAPVLVTQRDLLDTLPDVSRTTRIVCLEDLPARATTELQSHGSADNLAYVIYTSGSTGRPKGVQIPHRAAVNFLHAMLQQPGLSARDRLLAVTTLSFDIAALELFLPLIVGAQVVIAPREVVTDGQQLAHLLVAEAITVMQATPATWRLLLHAGWEGQPGLKILCGGEPLPRALADQLLAGGMQLWNMYGPTETTIWSSLAPIEPADDRIPIGGPIANTQLYVLDRQMQLLPLGVPGELYIGGDGLARGYHNRPDLTAERFVPNPFSANPGARMYRTGDLMRYREDRTLDFLGRIDHQVKVRGFRIELGEIETALRQHEHVREAVVMVRHDGGDARLVAYVVGEQTNQETKEQSTETLPSPAAVGEGKERSDRGEGLVPNLREFLQSRLPEYMIPSLVMQIDALPLTPNGKIDRAALPAPDTTRVTSAEAFVAPRTPVEQQLAAIWAEILGLERVSIHDRFFELGGDSIRSIQVITKANHAGIPIAPKHLFSHPTIAQLAELVGDLPDAAAAAPLPLTPAQRWLVEQQPAALDTQYHTLRVALQRRLEPALVDTAVRQLVTLHEALRLRVWHDDSGWHQRIDAAPQPAPVAVILAATAGDPAQLDAAIAELGAQIRASTGDLLRVALVETGVEQPPQLVLLTHPVAVDGTTEELLLNDLFTLYDRLARGDVASVPPAASFKHWVEQLQVYAQGERLRQEHDTWLQAAPAHVAPLRVDHAAEGAPLTRRVVERLTRDETAALTGAIATTYHAQLPEIVVAALVQSLSAWTGTDTLLLDLADESRDVPIDGLDLTRLAGCCTSVFPVALPAHRSADPGAALQAVKEQLRAVPQHGLGYGLLRATEHDPQLAEQLAQQPQAEVLFRYVPRHLSAPAAALVAARLDSTPAAGPWSDRYRLAIQAEIVAQQLQLSWSYNERCYQPATIARLAADVSAALRALLAHGQAQDAVSYTPADFPMANLGQRDLDKVLSKLRKAKGPNAR